MEVPYGRELGGINDFVFLVFPWFIGNISLALKVDFMSLDQSAVGALSLKTHVIWRVVDALSTWAQESVEILVWLACTRTTIRRNFKRQDGRYYLSPSSRITNPIDCLKLSPTDYYSVEYFRVAHP